MRGRCSYEGYSCAPFALLLLYGVAALCRALISDRTRYLPALMLGMYTVCSPLALINLSVAQLPSEYALDQILVQTGPCLRYTLDGSHDAESTQNTPIGAVRCHIDLDGPAVACRDCDVARIREACRPIHLVLWWAFPWVTSRPFHGEFVPRLDLDELWYS